MRHISVTELKERLDTGNCPVLLDVRESWEHALCQLENAKHIPMSSIAEKVGELHQADETVVICHHGARSLQVGQYLENLGFQDIMNLQGGLDAWAKTIDPNMPQY